MQMDDCWFRDTGPTFVVRAATGDAGVEVEAHSPTVQRCHVARSLVRGVDWCFNAWGEVCYGAWDLDDLVARKVCDMARVSAVQPGMVLEGGSIHVDGEGTLLTTKECLLNPNRNPGMSQDEIEAQLRRYLGVSTCIWLEFGVEGDVDTSGHVDNMACFLRPGVVALHWTDDTNDPQ